MTDSLKIIAFCEEYIHNGYHIQLSITDINQDSEIVRKLSSELNQSNIAHDVFIPDHLKELCDIISNSAVVYSGRMHALIIGYSYGCQCIPYIVSDKLEVFKNEILDHKVSLNDIQDQINNNVSDILVKNVNE